MAEKLKQQKPRKKSAFDFIFTPFGWFIGIAIYIVISIIVGTLIEWAGMLFFWNNNHAEKILYKEFQYLGNNFSTTIFGMSARDTAISIIQWLNSHIMTLTNVNQNSMMFERFLADTSDAFRPYINAFFYIVMITAIRCMIILLSSIMFIVVGIAAMTDGLYQRELRKVSGDVEHGFKYHHSKSWIGRIITISPLLYLAWPGSINPNYILLPGVILFYFTVMISFSSFKKYL